MLYQALRPLLFALEPERAHALTLRALAVRGALPASAAAVTATVMGLGFANRVGLAAGFDKNGEAVDGAARLGFGFVEVGTVTPRPQQGQPRPRVFRKADSAAFINRMGFPNRGAEACARRLAARRSAVVVGVNIGKNADTPLDAATGDYVAALRAVHAVAGYVAINISSPNTRSLRELHEPPRLRPLLAALVGERARLRQDGTPLPLLLKISPDLDDDTLSAVLDEVCEAGFDGVIATNTTLARPGRLAGDTTTGGLSGAPLHERALEVVERARRGMDAQRTIIGVGGVDSARAALAMRAAGADLVQLYTGLVYRGPRLVRECARALS